MKQAWCFKDVCLRVALPVGLALALAYMFGFVSCGNIFDNNDKPQSSTEPAAETPAPPVMTSPVRLSMGSLGNTIAVTGFSESGVFVLSVPGLVQSVAFEHTGGPLGIAWGPLGLFIGNSASASIDIYSGSGLYIREFASGAGRPSDLAFDSSTGLLLSVDSIGRRVLAFDSSGALINTIPAAGQQELYSPTAVALDPVLSEVYVSDYGNSISAIPARISAYGYDGTFRYSIVSGSAGTAYRFSRPQGLHADGSGRIYMADGVLGKVLAFSTATKLGVASYGTFGTGAGMLSLPLDIDRDPATGRLYVTDNREGVIEVFTTP